MRFSICAIFLLVLMSRGSASAQTAEISGQIMDGSGAVLPGVHIRAVNQQTLVERHATSNGVGRYVLPFLDPGPYQLIMECPGFQTAISQTLTISVGQGLVFNLRLHVGAVTEAVTAIARPDPVDTTSSEVSNLVSQHQVTDLPLVLRDPYQLALLSAGVNPTNSGDGGFSTNGNREENNDFRLDGASINDVEFPTGGIISINPDAIQEFRVTRSGYMPEFGRNNGAVVNIVTKPGTNEFHGNIYQFGRYTALGARDFFNPTGTRKDGYTRNTFGASLGGPVVKEKTFFFFNFDESRNATTRTNFSIVPSKALLSGRFTYSRNDPNNGQRLSVPIDVSRLDSPMNRFHLLLDPVALRILGLFPAPTVELSNGLEGELFFPSRDLSVSDGETVMVDHNFSSSHALTVRYITGRGTSTNPIHTDVLPSFGSISTGGRSQLLSLHLTSSLRTNFLNEFMADANRIHLLASCSGVKQLDRELPSDQFGNGFDLLWPARIAHLGCFMLGDSNGQERSSGAYSIADHLALVEGRHTIKAGLELTKSYSNNHEGFQSRPLISFDNFSSFGIPAIQSGTTVADSDPVLQDAIWALFGEVSFEEAAQFFNPNGARMGTDEVNMRMNDVGMFAQDSYQLFKNLSINYGLRWNFTGVPYEAHHRLFTVTPKELNGGTPVTFRSEGTNGVDLYSQDWFAVQPRIGIAWDPFKSGKTAIRASYGIYRDRPFFAVADSTRSNPPFTESFANILFRPLNSGFIGTSLSNLQTPASITPTATVGPIAFLTPNVIDSKFRLPYSQNWNIGIQREIRKDLALDINYAGAQGKHLLRTVDGNQPQPGLVKQLRSYCAHPNPFNCVDSPEASTVQGVNLFDGAELGILPFDAVNNSAFFHATLFQGSSASTYHALQSMITMRFSHGFIQVSHSWAHEIDDAAAPIAPTIHNQPYPANSYDLRRERSNGSLDIRQSLTLNYTAELPLGSGKSHLNHGLGGKILQGWSMSGIVSLSSGFPYDILTLRDSDGTGGLSLTRPDFNPHARPSFVNDPRALTGPNPGLFSAPPFGRAGNLPRNVFRAPGVNNWDASCTKLTGIGDRIKLEFRAEVYNVFNHIAFAPADNILESPTFGLSRSEVGRNDGTSGARQLQFALKLGF